MADFDLDAIADEELAVFGGFGENWKIRTIKAVRDRVRDRKPSVSLREIGRALDRAVLRAERKANPTRFVADLTPYPIDAAIELAGVADDLESLAREIAAEREDLAREVARLRKDVANYAESWRRMSAERDRLCAENNALRGQLDALLREDQS